MKLKDLEKILSPVILKRGAEYRDDGRIVDMEEVEEGIFHAQVEGSELYEVKVIIDSRGEIEFSECDCPFDRNAFCKHQAAVLLEIRDQLPRSKAGRQTKPKSKTKLSDQLEALSKEQLIELLLEYAKEIPEVRRLLSLRFAKADGKEDLQSFAKLIRTYVRQNSDRGGFVPYRAVSRALTGAEMVMGKANEALERGEPIRAARIGFCVLHELTDLLQTCDDSDGLVGGMIEECLGLASQAAEGASSLSASERKELFRMLLEEARHPGLEDWGEWQLSLLESATLLVGGEEERKEWEISLQRLLDRNARSGTGSYFANEAAVLKYRLIRRFDDEKTADEFLRENIELSNIRELAIHEAIAEQRYDEALRLAREGERLDAQRGYPGLVDSWKKLRLEVCRLTKDEEEERRLTEEFALNGEYSYYEQLKRLYTPEEWPDVYARVLAGLERGSWKSEALYTKLLVEERETDRLLQYVARNPYAVVEYYKHLVDKYPDEVYRLFEIRIGQEMEHASDRKGYRQVCRLIRELIQAGGKRTAENIVLSLRQRYANRPALLQELQAVPL